MTEYGLRHGAYTAVITARGAAVRVLQHGGRDLVLPFPAGGPNPQFRGVVVAPWPNRIPDGEYTFDGINYRVPVNEPDRQCALHGFTPELDWTLGTQAESALTLSCSIGPTPGYPFALTITAQYRLDSDGLHTTVTAANTGERAAPYGVCPHPRGAGVRGGEGPGRDRRRDGLGPQLHLGSALHRGHGTAAAHPAGARRRTDDLPAGRVQQRHGPAAA